MVWDIWWQSVGTSPFGAAAPTPDGRNGPWERGGLARTR